MKSFIGIYSDAEPVDKTPNTFVFFNDSELNTIKKTKSKSGILLFSAESLFEALQIAKTENLSTFAEISGNIYRENIDF